MTLKYIARIEDSEDYFINNNYKLNDLLKLDAELEEAQKVISIYRSRIAMQYNKATQTVETIKITATRKKNDYSSDKKVKIVIQSRIYKMLDGVEVSNNHIYGDHKEFSYQDKSEALLHVYTLLKKYPGSRYYNESTYKFMEV